MIASHALNLNRQTLAGCSFRTARIFLLLLIIVLPMAAITATREVAMAGMALFLAISWWARNGLSFRKTAVFLPLVFYAFCAVFSLISAVDFKYSLSEVRSEIIKPLVIFYSGVHFVDRPEHLRQAYGGILVCAALMVVCGILLFFHNGGSLLSYQLRAGSLHNGYGTFSTFLVTVWPFVVLAALVFDQQSLRKPLWLLNGLTAFAGYITFSRACWISMLVELWLVWVVISKKRLKVLASGVAVILIGLLIFSMLPGSRHGENWDELMDRPHEIGGTTGDLFVVWNHTLGEIAKHPFTGIGLGRHSFSKSYPDFRDDNQPLLWHAHNMFLDIGIQTGVQGLLALLWFLGALVYYCWPRSPLQTGHVGSVFCAATAIMIAGFCLRNMTDDFYADDSALMVYLLAGLAMGAYEAFTAQSKGGTVPAENNK